MDEIARMGMIFLSRRRYHSVRAAKYGITLKQLFVLGYLARHGETTPSRIAELLFCDRPTASVILANCAKHGWISKTRDPVDGRSYVIRAEEAGLDLVRRVEGDGALEGAPDPLDFLDVESRREFGEILRQALRRARELYPVEGE